MSLDDPSASVDVVDEGPNVPAVPGPLDDVSEAFDEVALVVRASSALDVSLVPVVRASGEGRGPQAKRTAAVQHAAKRRNGALTRRPPTSR